MRKQLRDFYSTEELKILYGKPYNHKKWDGHRERINFSAKQLDQFARSTKSFTVADLSAGDEGLLKATRWPWHRKVVGDITTTGPIEYAIDQLDPVDVFVCSETLEHIEDPDTLLRKIRGKSDHLFLTTPNGEEDNGNPEHYWGWDTSGLDHMLEEAGWSERNHILFTPPSDNWYEYQIWMCA